MRSFTCITTLVAAMFLGQIARAADDSLRPLYHFTADRGWLNDPNGLVFDGSQYHLFFQHKAGALRSDGENLTWGHATSTDLLHWKQLPEAIDTFKTPDGKSASAWSGTAVIDKNNTSGFGTAENPPMVAFWTATHLGQCMAYSTDHGKTFTRYEQNPVIPKPEAQQGDWDRDPDVFWYAPGKHWVLIYSISHQGYAVNSSTDLKHWKRESLVPGYYECPNAFELQVDGNPQARKWVLWDASGKYQIGAFDGKEFKFEAGPFKLDHGKNYYAAQTWSDSTDGRRIGIGWMNGGRFPNQVFNQQMGIPYELSLKTIPDVGLRLVKYPVREVESLRSDEQSFKDLDLKNENPLKDVHGEALDFDMDVERPAGSTFTFEAAGQKLTWRDDTLSVGAANAKLSSLPKMNFRILLDRASIEVFADHGRISFTNSITPTGKPTDVSISGAGVKVPSLHVWKLKATTEK